MLSHIHPNFFVLNKDLKINIDILLLSLSVFKREQKEKKDAAEMKKKQKENKIETNGKTTETNGTHYDNNIEVDEHNTADNDTPNETTTTTTSLPEPMVIA